MAVIFGLSDSGFVRKRLADIFTDQRAQAVALFQDQVAVGDVIDTSSSSVLGRLIAIDSAGDALLWEQLEALYSAFDPNSATGVSLDNLVALGGITRQSETFSTASAVFAGDNGTLIDAGLTVGSITDSSQWSVVAPVALSPSAATGITVQPLSVANNTLYTISYTSVSTTNTISYNSGAGATTSSIVNGIAALVGTSHPTLRAVVDVNNTSVTISRADQFAVVTFSTSTNLGITKVQKIGELISVVAGDVSAEANTLTNILTPKLGWDSVYNPAAASEGRFIETDEELRLRFRDTKFERGSNILESLYSSLINLDGVDEVRIYENDTDSVNSLGVPAHSFMPIVLGGLSSDIANAIWNNKPMGILSFGDTTVVITDSQGFSHPIGFKRPTPVPIYITMNLTTDSNFPATGDADIRSALISYFDTLGIGDDVIYSRLYTPINTVKGFQVNSLFIGTAANPTGTSNIVINFDSLASLSSANILISH